VSLPAGAPGQAIVDFDVLLRRGPLPIAAAGTVPPGGCLALFGPSGAGKSSILAALAGLIPIDAGHVRIGPRLLSFRRPGGRLTTAALRDRRVGLLAQQPALFPHLDVRANIGYGVPAGDRAARVASLADALELGPDALDAHPGQLSGGQLQRAALARALAPHPELLLLDEPATGLDRRLAERVAAAVAAERSAGGPACILVTHVLADAQRWADDILVVDLGQPLQRSTAAELVRRPARCRVAELVGYEAFVPADACLGDGRSRTLSPPAGATTVALHPGSVVLTLDAPVAPGPSSGPPPVVIPARVRAVGVLGGGLCVTLELPGGGTLHAMQPPGPPVPRPGDAVRVAVADPPWFDSQGNAVGRGRAGAPLGASPCPEPASAPGAP
jgi:ABC-type sulfate/molybdate transport systems ATPase subunit